MSAAGGLQRVGTFIQAWFLGRSVSRWRSTRGRWLQVGLTVTLLAAGLAAWALALLQPWQAQAARAGMVAVPGQPPPQEVRAAAQEAEYLLEREEPAPLPPLARDPFKTPAWAEPPCETAPSVPALTGGPPCAKEGAATAEQVAEIVQRLNLKATVRSTRGERWAVINEKAYRKGDEVAGLTLVEVGNDRATLRAGDVTCVLRMD